MLRNRRVGAAEQDAEIGVLSPGGPRFLALDHPVVAVALGAAGEAGEVAAGARLAEELAPQVVAAQQAVGFPVGHASAQQVWRGLRSRPTWRVLCYSAEEPPTRRGLVLVDAVDGSVVEHLVEDNPEHFAA